MNHSARNDWIIELVETLLRDPARVIIVMTDRRLHCEELLWLATTRWPC